MGNLTIILEKTGLEREGARNIVNDLRAIAENKGATLQATFHEKL